MSFKDIAGHTKEISVLKNSLGSGRVAHSLLFAGPDGVGKSLVALEFAKALNCQRFSGDSCGECQDCAMIAASTHPNLILAGPEDKDGESTPDGLIRIERVREIQNSIKYRVDRGKKVVIIDAADRMMTAASNAFLKTLEEPPADSIIILVSSRSSDLLPTIISRCQRMNFRPLPPEVIASFLEDRRGIAHETAIEAARLADGSVARALLCMDDGGLERKLEAVRRLSAITPADTDEALRLAEELAKRDDLAELLEFMKTWYRDRLVVAEGAERLALNPADRGQATDDPRRLMDSFSMIERARRDIMPPRYANKQLVMEGLLLGLTGCLES
jgi:DNA polymerase III subunit delta'